jgi:hypothetical protein
MDLFSLPDPFAAFHPHQNHDFDSDLGDYSDDGTESVDFTDDPHNYQNHGLSSHDNLSQALGLSSNSSTLLANNHQSLSDTSSNNIGTAHVDSGHHQSTQPRFGGPPACFPCHYWQSWEQVKCTHCGGSGVGSY